METKMKKIIFLLASILLASQAVLVSAEDKAAGTGPSPYVDCGIGAALFKDTAWAAVTSNIIWDAGTTAVISATASPETCNAKAVEVTKFINHSYDNLIEETAQGSGNYLNAMLDIYSCDENSRSKITADVRVQVAKKVSDAGYLSENRKQKVTSYYNIVSSTVSNKYSQSCSV